MGDDVGDCIRGSEGGMLGAEIIAHIQLECSHLCHCSCIYIYMYAPHMKPMYRHSGLEADDRC